MLRDFGVNQAIIEELWNLYKSNPSSVSQEWRLFFAELDTDEPTLMDRITSSGQLQAPKAHPIETTPTGSSNAHQERSYSSQELTTERQVERLAATEIQSRVSAMVNAFRVRGHLFASLDPLGMLEKPPFDLSLESFGLDKIEPSQSFVIPETPTNTRMSLKDIMESMGETYCRSIGVEYTQIEDPTKRSWLQEKMEDSKNRLDLSREEQVRILSKLTDAESWEHFVHNIYKGAKRFSCEGGESVIPLTDLLIQHLASNGAEEVVIGMAHRGRLNMLINVLGQKPHDLLAGFEDNHPERLLGRGDVKYHWGHSGDVDVNGKKVHLTLAFNPSHLEFVNPVVEGRVRSKQERRAASMVNAGSHPQDAKTSSQAQVVPLLIHGDAAFIGQGVVAETLNLSNLRAYSTGGTVHIVINNQIGFTTNVEDSRSTRYCTDIVRMLRCPVFHVNGEDPEAVAQVALLAAEYRQRFQEDVVIDLYCYRKYGHNESDEPRFTQPVMYQAIDKKDTVRQVYVNRLLEKGKITAEEAELILANSKKRLDDALTEVRATQHIFQPAWLTGLWSTYQGGSDHVSFDCNTSVKESDLFKLMETLGKVPEGFKLMRQIQSVQKTYADAAKQKQLNALVPWFVGENLAYASLLAEGRSIRITGQDVERGTFGHRNAVLSEMETGQTHVPLRQCAEKGARLEIFDSSLSEAGVLGFEYGYSMDAPDSLVIWEAQFGDFANGAQVIIDQFIVSGEDKWHRLSGLVLLLPHGYEGAGPEHSSARLERFLALASEDNIQVVNLTSSAQIFHALRKQVLSTWRKPLIVMSPKSLLRNPLAASPLSDFTHGEFKRIIPDTSVSPKKTSRILLCSGKIYFDLVEHRTKTNRDDVAIVRLEQLYPIREQELQATMAPYTAGTEIVWVQEEPWNSGAWFFLNARLPKLLDNRHPISVVSRAESASPATGSSKAHKIEQEQLVQSAFQSSKPQKRASKNPKPANA